MGMHSQPGRPGSLAPGLNVRDIFEARPGEHRRRTTTNLLAPLGGCLCISQTSPSNTTLPT